MDQQRIKRNRRQQFLKRKKGLFNKAFDLAELSGSDITITIITPESRRNGGSWTKVYCYKSRADINLLSEEDLKVYTDPWLLYNMKTH